VWRQDAGLGADVADLAQVSRSRDDHAGLALDGLDQEGDGVLVDRFAQGVGVAEADDLESRSVGAVVVVGQWVGRESHQGDGAAVEAVGAGDDLGPVGRDPLDLVAPLAGGLDGGLDRLGAGVHQQHGLHAAQLGQGFAEWAEPVVVDGAAGQGDPLQLGAGCLQELRMPVAEVHRRVGRDHVEVAPPTDVGRPGTLRLRHDQRQLHHETTSSPDTSSATAAGVPF
jgi:hypothetical protein